jgi:putative membrane protein
VWHHEGSRWFGLFGGLLWLILIGVIIYLLVSLVAPRHEMKHGDEDPLEIVRRRYAKGEITREEYEQMRKDLTGRPPPG